MRVMEKYFNTAGPCIPAEHYMLPAFDRLPEIRRLVAQRRYFVIHAPRQTGKTTALNALVDEINGNGEMAALYCTLETLQNAKDPDKSNLAIRDLMFDNYEAAFPAGNAESGAAPHDGGGTGLAVRNALRSLCRRAGKPFVVFFDEGYLDKLGLAEGWMPIFDPDAAKPWEEKLYTRDIELGGKILHVVGL